MGCARLPKHKTSKHIGEHPCRFYVVRHLAETSKLSWLSTFEDEGAGDVFSHHIGSGAKVFACGFHHLKAVGDNARTMCLSQRNPDRRNLSKKEKNCLFERVVSLTNASEVFPLTWHNCYHHHPPTPPRHGPVFVGTT